MPLPPTPVNASVTFQPLLDNGIVVMVTADNGTVPVLAVGLFNGEVKFLQYVVKIHHRFLYSF